MRKKPTNLTLSDEIRMRGRHIMQQRGFTNFTAFVEQLIREAWERHVPPVIQPPSDALRDRPDNPQLPSVPANETDTSYLRRKRKRKP